MAPTQPLAGDVHVNRPLTNFAQKYLLDQADFVSLDAMPNLPVSKQGDLYWEYNKGDFLRDEATERADGAESSGGAFRQSTSPYFAKVYAFHKDVTDRQRANQDPIQGTSLDETATEYVAQKMMIKRERLFAAAYMAGSIWTTDRTLSGADQWTNSGSDPIQQVRLGKRTVQALTGKRPNRMTMGRESWDALLDNDALLARITGGANNQLPAEVLKVLVAQLFELESIHVMDAVFNSALKGATDVIDYVVGDSALLHYAPARVGPGEPTSGVQFSWTGLLGNTNVGQRISRFRIPAIQSDRVEGEMAFDYKVVGVDLGYMFLDTNA